MDRVKWVAGVLAMASMAPGAALAETRDDRRDEVVAEMSDELGTMLADPALPDRMAAMTLVLAKMLETMPVGEIEAAIEGREPTPEERAERLEVDGPAMADEMRTALADNQDTLRASARGLALAMPHLLAAIDEMRAAVEPTLDDD
ncbi:hypothetical protein [Sphingomicrobium nitratireducens]|uniref:hypothetical protein n=1 Tax=Sphingomicrobium nitratireducens TaxID=2964666 RepID=UPI00223EB42B|nr:hypothetical protein [Sphingomicrobium nitratireducens]